jgi:GMP synthase (glutamine-hydrolysing)
MILILDITHPGITVLYDEFVAPVERIVQACNHPVRVVRIDTLQTVVHRCTGLIICGTALADSWYRTQELFPLLGGWTGPVLGICAGMQMLLLETGGTGVPLTEIGMIPIQVTETGTWDILMQGKDEFSGYALHQYTVTRSPLWMSLARSTLTDQVVRHCIYPWYGVLFHPEVRNEWIIERFVAMTRSVGPISGTGAKQGP